VPIAELPYAAQVARRLDDHSGLSLDRLEQHRGGALGDYRSEGVDVAVGHRAEAGGERAEIGAGLAVGGERHDRGGATMEAGAGGDDFGAVGRYTLDLVGPLAGDLDRGFHRLRAGVHRQHHPDTAGRAPAGTQLEVLDEDGHQVDGGVVGRVFVGNGMLFEGYTRVGEDKEVVRGMMSTGDLGHLDDGLLYIDGRSDDMVVSGGENVYPGEVEDLINELDGVREVVVGVDDEKFGARLAAYVVREPNSGGDPVDSDSIRAHVKAGLARFSVPRDVVFLDELPRNATGKVVARDLPSSTE